MSDELCHLEHHFYALLISDLINFCNFIFSDPLYLSYFVFFSPYLLRLVSFLSPLFLTTFILFFALFTGIVHENISSVSILSEKNFGDDGLQGSDDLGIYEILFGTLLQIEENENPAEVSEEKVEESPELGSTEKDSSFSEKKGVFEAKLLEQKNPSSVPRIKNSCPGLEERRLENFLKILDQFEKMSTVNVEEKKKIVPKIPKAASEGVNDHVTAKITVENAPTPVLKPDSQRLVISDVSNDNHSGQVENEHNQKGDSFRTWSHNSWGSLRKEKEWRRTLACKLFEERHNVDGGEGMDSLWEVYEMDSDKSKSMGEKKKKKNSTKKTREIIDDEDEEDEVVDGQLCCLQAVRLSAAGKINLGMGRPNLVKISKAIKGFGWLHHVSKHSKKVHNNGDR